jgi:glycosyltransferase involved in cell wall biosynthesis
LITVYNRERYLAETLSYIGNSSFSDFEVIVVDDHSSDGSLKVAHNAAESDSRIRIFQNKSNLGDYPNRMRAASLARGRYLKYVDSDDLIYQHSLAFMVDSMEKYPQAALGLAHSMPEDKSPYPWCLNSEQAYRKHFLGRGCLSCGPTGAIIRRDAFEEVGGFRGEWGVLSDIDLWYRMAARWSTVLLPPGLVWWRRHEGQEFSLGDADIVYLQCGYQLTTEVLRHYENPLSADDRDQALNRATQHFARKLWSLALRQGKATVALELYRKSELSLTDLAKGIRGYQ